MPVTVATQTNWFLRRRKAVAGAGGKGENDFIFFAVKLRQRLAEQIELKIRDLKFQIRWRALVQEFSAVVTPRIATTPDLGCQ